MQSTPPCIDKSLIRLLVAGSLTFVVPTANAGYTVIDDDLLPTAMVQARMPESQSHHTIPFVKDRSPLTNMGRNELTALIPQMRGASIRIVGRPDAIAYSSGKMSLIPSRRANNIRDYLTRQGIQANDITIEIDNTPNPQQNGSIYPCDIYITRIDNRTPMRSQTSTASYAPAQIYTQAPQPIAATNVATNGSRDRLIRFINQAVQSGQMTPAVALNLMRSLIESDQKNAPQQTVQNQAVLPQTQVPVTQFVAKPAIILKETWVLDKTLTLRDNVAAWSKKAGWNPSVWDATNYYQVTATSTLDGGFPDVLRQIADSTGLNICAKNREKYVRVTDSTVSCK